MSAAEPPGKGTGRPGVDGRRLFVVLAAVFAVAGVAFAGVHEVRRVEHEQAFCASSCHRRVEASAGGEAWHAAGHAKLECQQCHTTTVGLGLKLALQAFTGSRRPSPHGQVDPTTCANCHAAPKPGWPPAAETQGHRQHSGLPGVDCLSCHATGVHTAEAPEKICAKCHADERLHKATTVGAETCLSCHSFAASTKNATPPTTIACERCHARAAELRTTTGASPMRDVEAHGLHGGVACQLCHNAHGKKPAPGQSACAQCHKFETFQVANEDRSGPEGHSNCEGCHKPHAPLATALVQCVRCHEKNAKGLAAAEPPGHTTALKHTNCASCHVPHTWRAERSGCMQCHAEETQLVLTRSPVEHNQCTNCHEVHGPPPTGAICLKCHSDTKGHHVALAPERHKDCTSCHNPHAPRPEDTRTSCAKCHDTEVTQLVRDGPEGHLEKSCFGCHQPHDSPLPPPNVCAKCHADKAARVATAAPPMHRVCTSCHERHVFKIADPKTACARCHGPMFDAAATGFEKVPHQGDCKSCHQLHGSPGIARSSCLGCHTKVAGEFNPPNETHAVCRSCHQPHTPASTAVARCATCHEAKAEIAVLWPPESAHAKACNSCHQQHDVRNKKACAECHVQEAASAEGSKHRCVQCHSPHTAPPGTGAAWWSRCSQCHAAKVESVKERGPTHSKCQNCHQQHRFAVPSCATCHNDMASRGLHAVQPHAANCTACHDPHVEAPPARTQCLVCHTNKVQHEPNAPRCQTCHLFK
jgi:hypothetical protein